ncbi:MAG: hypothetical protein SCH70_06905 [Candidatus Methanoperedens sp.]|nr:hypothetical protein [Candidatus Methanoperedens sp.]
MADEMVKVENVAVTGAVVSAKPKDESREFVDGIMAELGLKGGSKKRLVKALGEQCGYDRHKVMWRLKRALITERYAAVVESGGGH